MDLVTTSYLRFVLALVFVVGLLLGLLWLLRRLAPAGMITRPAGRRRLGVVESAAVDSRRRLVLVRRDDTEHLLLIGGGNDLVIESRAASPAAEDNA
jgi:flagellar protein FliO/FliZ